MMVLFFLTFLISWASLSLSPPHGLSSLPSILREKPIDTDLLSHLILKHPSISKLIQHLNKQHIATFRFATAIQKDIDLARQKLTTLGAPLPLPVDVMAVFIAMTHNIYDRFLS